MCDKVATAWAELAPASEGRSLLHLVEQGSHGAGGIASLRHIRVKQQKGTPKRYGPRLIAAMSCSTKLSRRVSEHNKSAGLVQLTR